MRSFLKCLFISALFLGKIYSQNDVDVKATIGDYFLPLENNKSTFTFSMPQTANNGKVEQTLQYSKLDSSNGMLYCNLTTSSYLNGTKYAETVSRYQLSKTEVKLLEENSWSAFGGYTQNTGDYPQTILKLPSKGKVVKWKYKKANGCICECVAQMILIDIKYNIERLMDDGSGNVRYAIKVTKKVFEGKKLITWDSVNEYYVMGIGYWKTQSKEGSDYWILKDQSREP